MVALIANCTHTFTERCQNHLLVPPSFIFTPKNMASSARSSEALVEAMYGALSNPAKLREVLPQVVRRGLINKVGQSKGAQHSLAQSLTCKRDTHAHTQTPFEIADTALNAAAANGYEESVGLLLAHGADPSIADKDNVSESSRVVVKQSFGCSCSRIVWLHMCM